MRFSSILLAGAIFTTLNLAQASTASAESFKRVATEAEYRDLVVGKKSVYGSDWYKTKANGKIVGMRGGKKYRANWAWRDGFLCRTELTHRKDTDCQLWEVSKSKIRITRTRGKGESFTVPRQ